MEQNRVPRNTHEYNHLTFNRGDIFLTYLINDLYPKYTNNKKINNPIKK